MTYRKIKTKCCEVSDEKYCEMFPKNHAEDRVSAQQSQDAEKTKIKNLKKIQRSIMKRIYIKTKKH